MEGRRVRMNRKCLPLIFLVTICSHLLVMPVAVFSQTTFYQGKTLRIIVGSDSGGLYDLWARLLAKHMPKHIPGGPNMIVQNMPGAGGLAATNYLYGLTKSDGLTLGMFQAHRYMQQLTGAEEV